MADTCPDCGRPPVMKARDGEGCLSFALLLKHGLTDDMHHRECLHVGNKKLRARVAELEQAHSEQVAEREHLEEGARLLMEAYVIFHGPTQHYDEHRRWLKAERARQAKLESPPASGGR